MELWIRSQDKTKLFKAETLFLSNDVKCYSICGRYNFTTHSTTAFELGNYKTKERALEVLDEIQRKIAFFNAMSTVHDTESFEKLCEAIGDENLLGLASPYQMPEE